ncbi:MAG: hypothetical protein PHT88_02940 [Candidatus Moranbacteria bacterium]|nr:hypothetical protein [Candidatus Moranbacteria bacterium]
MTNNDALKFDPLLVNIHPNGVYLTQPERVAMWMNLRDVPEDVYVTLSSPLVAEAIFKMKGLLQLTDDVAMKTASLLRLLYFKKTTLEQFSLALKNDVDFPQDKVEAAMNFIRTEILTLKAEKKVTEEAAVKKASIVEMALLDALSKYSRLNDQQVTGSRLKIRSEKELVRGSVRNWLRAYRDIVGARKHSSVERGQFLFQAENTKNLTMQDREKISLILKSLDENEPISIDAERQEIIFPAAPTMPPLSKSVSTSAPKPAQPIAAPLPKAAPAKMQESYQDFPSATAPEARPFSASSIPMPPKTQTPFIKSFNFSKSSPSVPAMPQTSSVMSAATDKNFSSTPSFTPKAAPLTLKPLHPSSPDAFQFSSGQTLPAEKQATSAASLKPKAAKSSFGLGYSSGPSPTAQKKEVWDIPPALQNVVDLRSDE